MIKYLFFFISFPLYASIDTDLYDSELINIEQEISISKISNNYQSAKGHLQEQLIKNILDDYQKKLSGKFKITNYFKDSVSFWFQIYTRFDSREVLIHDKSNLSLVYNVLNFHQLHDSSINRFSKSKIQAKLSLEYATKLKKSLKRISRKNYKSLNKEEKSIYDKIKKSYGIIPKNKKRFFSKLSRNLRTQTGQRDQINAGIIRYMPYQDFLREQMRNFKLPTEVLGVAFLESSFNPKAYSKVAAAGIWQFMPLIGNLLMPRRTKDIDYRLNPIISSVSALHLLKENRMILKRWDFAIPAYNSGTKNFVEARRKYKKVKDLNLEYILENYKHSSIGFASKNFYAEFLALAHVLAYKNQIYSLTGIKRRKNRNTKISIYISKCSIVPEKFFKLLSKTSPDIRELNSHFLKSNKSYPKGTIIISDRKLTKKRYIRVTNNIIRKNFPKNYLKKYKNIKCL